MFDKVWDYLIPDETGALSPTKGEKKPEVIQAVDDARLDWERARAYFDNVTDPDLIDHATYEIKAAERKYVYLLRRAQELGFHLEEPHVTQEEPRSAQEEPALPEPAEVEA